jgi:hypothetical protein
MSSLAKSPGGAVAARARIFISYSRKDASTAERLRSHLIAAGFEAYLDKQDILPGEPWQERIGRLIECVDSVVFLISPDSVASRICEWEVNEAERLLKRIVPIVVRDTAPDAIPGRLKRLNFSCATPMTKLAAKTGHLKHAAMC